MASLKVKGMNCQHCVSSVTQALEQIDSVHSVTIDLKSGLVQYETNGDVDLAALKAAIVKIGFTPE